MNGETIIQTKPMTRAARTSAGGCLRESRQRDAPPFGPEEDQDARSSTKKSIVQLGVQQRADGRPQKISEIAGPGMTVNASARSTPPGHADEASSF